MKRIILSLALLTLSTVSIAATPFPQKNSLDVSLRSYHFNDRCYDHCTKEYNEANYGVSVSLNVMQYLDVTFGTLSNSFNQNTVFAAANIATNVYQFDNIKVRTGFAIGVADGYKDTPSKFANDKGIVPVLSPNVSLYWGRLHFNVGVLPSANTVVGIFRAGISF